MALKVCLQDLFQRRASEGYSMHYVLSVDISPTRLSLNEVEGEFQTGWRLMMLVPGRADVPVHGVDIADPPQKRLRNLCLHNRNHQIYLGDQQPRIVVRDSKPLCYSM
jgi:hypothetical protein